MTTECLHGNDIRTCPRCKLAADKWEREEKKRQRELKKKEEKNVRVS